MDYITNERFDKLYYKITYNVKDTNKSGSLYRRLFKSFIWDDLPAFQALEKDTDKAIEEDSKN